MTNKKNVFEEDCRKEAENVEAYKAAKDAGDEEAMAKARDSHNAHMKELEGKGKIYCRIFWEYMQSMESGNEYLDIKDTVWDRDVEALITCMRENGVEHFTFSSTWSSAVETAWLFTKCGCKLEGLIEINSQIRDFMTGEYEKAHGYLFSLG